MTSSHPDHSVQELQTRLLKIACDGVPQTALMTALVVPPFAWLFWPLFPGSAMQIWCWAMLVNGLAQALFVWHWHFHSTAVSSKRWLWRFMALDALCGVTWAVGPILMLGEAQGVAAALLVGMLFAICAVITSTQAAMPAAMQVFIVAALAPSAVATWRSGDSERIILALVLMAGLACLIMVGRRSGQALRSSEQSQLALRAALVETQEARQRADAASQAKSRFLANMSHELRTPLNAVIGAAQLLRAEGDEQQRHYLVEAIQRGGSNLLGLIESVLDLSRIESGTLQLNHVDFHLIECIEAALSTTAIAARAKSLQLSCVIDPGLPAWHHGDPVRLRQVLLNLLGNAVKFTESGEITLRVRSGGEPRTVCIDVSDTGIGIPDSALGHIFDPFRQADEHTTRRFGGSGLGLSIVRQLVIAMGGRISVTSRPGVGSSFEVVLPLSPPPTSHTVTELALGLPVAFHEPHAASAEALHAHLRRLGCEVLRCDDFRQLVDWLHRVRDRSPWVLLASSPHTATLRESIPEWLDRQQVLEMTGDAADARFARVTGAPRQLLKPITRTALISALVPSAAKLLKRVRRRTADDAGPGHHPVHVLVVEDDELNRTLLGCQLQSAGHRVSEACNGVEALRQMRVLGPVDLILMDWQMPEMDGLEATRRLRAGEGGTAGLSVPIVALTANAFEEDRDTCLAAGMNDFVSKPVLADKLNSLIARWAGH